MKKPRIVQGRRFFLEPFLGRPLEDPPSPQVERLAEATGHPIKLVARRDQEVQTDVTLGGEDRLHHSLGLTQEQPVPKQLALLPLPKRRR